MWVHIGVIRQRVRLCANIAESLRRLGAMAQLVARFHGMEEVRSSNLLSSTDWLNID